ncbi:D-glucarate permease [Candidatus Paraburkholderia calva]|nr:D-glucarate permease [Candidatus Paraburkholderia calva]
MSSTSRAANPADIMKRTKVRYVILLLIFVITTFNYADSATLPVTGTAMRAEFGFDAVRMGLFFSAFSWAYVLSQVPAGWLLDRFGARHVYAASIFLWSLLRSCKAPSACSASRQRPSPAFRAALHDGRGGSAYLPRQC